MADGRREFGRWEQVGGYEAWDAYGASGWVTAAFVSTRLFFECFL